MEIDFDAASRAWRENKVSLGNGQFRYKCDNLDISSKHIKRKTFVVSNYNTRKKYKINS